MQKIVQEIIEELKYKYYINITPIIEMRIEELYNTGRVQSAADSERILQMLFHNEKMLFGERESFEIIRKWLFSAKRRNTRMLVVSADRGQSAYSARILMDIMKHSFEGLTVDVFSLNLCYGEIERALKPSYSYDVMMKANANELEYFTSSIETFNVKKSIVDNTAFINGSFFRMPFKDNMFDIVFIEDVYRYFSQPKHYILNNELYRVCSDSSVLLTSRKESENLMHSKFLVNIDDSAVYFTKSDSGESSPAGYVYTFEDAVEFFSQKKYDEAASIIHSLKETQSKNNLNLYKLLLLIYVRQDNLYKIKYLEKLFEINKVIHQDIYFIIGSYFFSKSDYSMAKGYLERALEIKSNFVFAEYYIALIDKFTGKTVSAKSRFKKIIDSIESNNVYHPELYSEGLSLDMIDYISENEISGGIL